MSGNTLLCAEQVVSSDVATLGGKTANLAWLSSRGYPVPQWWVLTTHAFTCQLEHLNQHAGQTTNNNTRAVQTDIEALSHPSADIDTLGQTIRDRFIQTPLHASIVDELQQLLATKEPDAFFAIRSSALGEDSAKASFAGQMDTFLYQQGLDQICRAVQACFASAFTDRAIRYRLQHGMDPAATKTAVIVQRMLDADVSGVFFTAHPVTGDRTQGLISACYGAGEGIVSGLCNTDEFVVDLFTDNIQHNISTKDIQLRFNDITGNGLKQIAVEHPLCDRPCLTDGQLLELRDIGRKIAAHKLAPQDIEWVLEKGAIKILQTRPVTSLPEPASPKGLEIVWDNSNIQESYCGVTTPLTFSFARRAYATVYEQTARLFGLPEHQLQSMQPVFENLLGLIKGRVYYNINNWYRGLMLLPFFKTNKADMERMMGLEDPVEFIEDQHVSRWQKLKQLPRQLRLLVTFLHMFRQMDTLVATFRQHFNKHYQRVDRGRLHTLEIAELLALAKSLDHDLMCNWQTPIINDCFLMSMNGKVNRWLEKAEVENATILQNNLMSGEQGIESTEPTKFLLRMCQEIRKDSSLSQLIASTEPQLLLELLQRRAPEIHQQCAVYIERYGDRCMGELKLESVTLRQDSSFLFTVLKNLLKRADVSAASLAEKETQVRSQAEKEATAAIVNRFGKRKLSAFFKDLNKLRAACKNRENMRLARTRMFGLYRDIYLEVGNQLAFFDLLEEPRDICYLTVEELDAYIDGRSVQTQFKPLVANRRAEYAEYEEETLSHRIVTHGPVYHHNSYTEHEVVTDANAEQLTGIGCYPGIVEQNVRLIFSPQDELDLDGQILCTVRTDPGWAPLFPTVSGLIIERGSTLSHSAVVARELGIPAIVNVPGLTKILRNGERVKIDGASGTVTRLSESIDSAA